jgi:F-box/leucine-rich repeat protein 2/20
MLQINVSDTAVTEVGLLSLANIGCLQNIAVVNSSGLRPSGVAAALLGCGGLRKAKLHASLRSLLPLSLIHHLEARGCAFLWKDNTLQVNIYTSICRLLLTTLNSRKRLV